MTSLRNRRPVAPPQEYLTWRTDPVEWKDLIQVTDSYATPALGYLIGSDLWLDHYGVRKDHRSWWDTHLQSEYGLREEADHIQFLVTPGGSLQILSPELDNVTEETMSQVETLARFMGFPGEARLYWAVSVREGNYQRLYLRDFYV